MRGEELRAYLDRQPFTRFEVLTSGGHRFPMRHPEAAWLTPGMLRYDLDGESAVDEPRLASISVMHIVALVPGEVERAGVSS